MNPDRPAGTAAKIDEFLHHARVRDLADADLLALRAEVAAAIAADADRWGDTQMAADAADVARILRRRVDSRGGPGRGV